MCSQSRPQLWFLVECFLLVTAPLAEAQTVVMVKGTGIQPPNLVKGKKLAAPEVVRVPANSIVVLQETWASDVPGFPCQSWVIISGSSYPVQSTKTEGQCPLSLRGDEMARARSGEAMVAYTVFYGDPSYDQPKTPPVVLRSYADSAGLRRDFVAISKQTGDGAPPPPQMGPLLQNQGFMGGTDYREVLQVASAAACSSLCASEQACVAMTYIVSDKKCYLKNGLTQLVSTGNMVSAVKK